MSSRKTDRQDAGTDEPRTPSALYTGCAGSIEAGGEVCTVLDIDDPGPHHLCDHDGDGIGDDDDDIPLEITRPKQGPVRSVWVMQREAKEEEPSDK